MSEPLANESRLIQQAQHGDREAFGALYEHYAPAVFRFLYAHMTNRLDAEDLTEEVFLRVWQALPGYQQRGAPFGGFIFRVARNQLYDSYRQARSRRPAQTLSENEWDDERAGSLQYLSNAQDDPAISVPQHLAHQELHQHLAELGHEHRMVLSLRFLAGLSAEETAQAMGKTAGAVRVLQHRALAALRKLFERPAPGHVTPQEGQDGSANT